MELIRNADLKQAWTEEIRKGFSGRGIPLSQQNRFVERLSGLFLKKGEHMVREGDALRRVALILRGIFRAYYLTESGDEKTIVFRGSGKPLSAYSSFLKGEAAKFSIQALEDSLILFMGIGDFESLLSDEPAWKLYTSQYYMDLFIEKEKRERELLSDDATTRYARFLEDYPGWEDRINHYHIASYLGISNVTLSRIRNNKY
ncbi:MAG: Crp/Fnr family transcriptional regulator [Spirochaetales bacterium]|nr:Crp/Fnr family transcriptional regulator [Spirochaetales bacterium]